MKFVAVVPSGTAVEKKAILDLGGEIVEATGATISQRAQEEALERKGRGGDAGQRRNGRFPISSGTGDACGPTYVARTGFRATYVTAVRRPRRG
ncbi:hypothetical protein [Streptomyces sp. NPDC088725]|uniref:hypothetical protein n=1 Tax=Streptomyces sp. NPDC088725 TaxID=3365873 RepID=UPI0037F1F7B8